MAAITRILGYWQPDADLSDESDENRERVGRQFKVAVAGLGFNVDTETVLTPKLLVEWRQREGDWFFDWHNDDNGADVRFIIWSNVQPTEIKFVATGLLLPVRNGAIILIDNLEVEHRTPSPLSPERWLARTRYL